MSDAMAVGRKLVELCRQNKALEAIDTLYSPKIVSIEAMSMPNMPARIEGIAAVRGKAEWWIGNHEVHSAKSEGPWPHSDRFIVHFAYEVTPKIGPQAGKRMVMDEAA